ncbi:hypothetical protein [Actinospongicola halichondriae]|uniref:hypothetical protein n=1 Tax=Actinospongicola halichondriae TaxID=3236844 RepID=UPI003D3DEE57
MSLARHALLAAALLAALASCGSDDDADTDAAPDDDTETPADAGSSDDSGSESGDSAAAGASTITVEGTTYQLDVSECEGSNTDSSGYPFPDNFALSGTDVDSDLQFYIARNGPADELFVQVGSLQGDFDENGQNEKLLYSAQMDTLDFTVNGPDVSGSVDVRAIGPTRPFGDETVVEFDFDC